jgi:hypothetical protein
MQVWLANLLADMISSQHAASLSPSYIDARRRYGHADSHQLFNAPNADF